MDRISIGPPVGPELALLGGALGVSGKTNRPPPPKSVATLPEYNYLLTPETADMATSKDVVLVFVSTLPGSTNAQGKATRSLFKSRISPDCYGKGRGSSELTQLILRSSDRTWRMSEFPVPTYEPDLGVVTQLEFVNSSNESLVIQCSGKIEKPEDFNSKLAQSGIQLTVPVPNNSLSVVQTPSVNPRSAR